MEAQGKWVRFVRLTAAVAAIGLLAALPLAAFAAAKVKDPEGPSYAISNVVVVVMCAIAIAISCKRYHRA